MAHGKLHLLLAPAQRAQETLELQLSDGLQAEPLGADVTCVGMLQRVHVDAPLCLRLARLECLVDDVQFLLLDKPRPVLVYLLTDNVAVNGHLILPQLAFALMLVLVGQAAGDVADLLGTQAVDETNVQEDARAGTAAGIAVGLLQAVILLILASLRIVSHLRREIHAAKVQLIFQTAVFYNTVLTASES